MLKYYHRLYYTMRFKVKVGPRGQIVIPKPIRERYGIREGGYAYLSLTERGVLVCGAPDPQYLLEKLSEIRSSFKPSRRPKLGELEEVELEEEFE